MFTFLRHASRRESLMIDGPAFVAALLIAEMVFKFHSFTLECLAFLATWLVLSSLLAVVFKPWMKPTNVILPVAR